jgi:predicted nucleic acid-binding protein
MRTYVDANVFLYAVLYDDARSQRCRKALEAIVAGRLEAVTSLLTWDEFSHVVERILGREVAVQEGERFLRFPRLDFLPCSMDVLVRAQRLRANTALGARDCLHAATALLAGATTFLSEDTDFDRVPGLTRQPA